LRKRCSEVLAARGLPRLQTPVNDAAAQLSSPVCYAREFPGYFGETEDK
jgi:hypothetical protein